MIHSLSGGILSEDQICDFAKVEIDGSVYWYKSEVCYNRTEKQKGVNSD